MRIVKGSTRANVPSTPCDHQESVPACRAPTRAEVERSSDWLQQGSRTKADLRVIDLGDGPLVVKDFSRKPWWIRGFGRLQIARECAAYRRLGLATGFPRLIGRIDRYALSLSWIDGVQLIHAPTRFSRGEDYLEQIRKCLARMHAVGLFHLDLRGRHNVLLSGDGRIHVLDLAAAVCLRPGGLAHRLWSPLLKAVDDAAYLKWKWILEVGEYTDEERRRVRRHRFWRSLWFLNRKGH
jgi:hypothetical protein